MKVALALLLFTGCIHTPAGFVTAKLPKDSQVTSDAERLRRRELFFEIGMMVEILRQSTKKEMDCWIGFDREVEGLSVSAAVDCRIFNKKEDPESNYEIVMIYAYVDGKWQSFETYR
jgi:hypothetical protein